MLLGPVISFLILLPFQHYEAIEKLKFYCCRLTRSTRSEESEYLSLLHLNIYISKCRFSTETFHYIFHFNCQCHFFIPFVFFFIDESRFSAFRSFVSLFLTQSYENKGRRIKIPVKGVFLPVNESHVELIGALL